MARYQGEYRSTLDTPDESSVDQNDEQLAATPSDAEEITYKKRYGDLRRHLSTKETEWQNKFGDLQRQFNDALASQVKMPKDENELQAFYSQYPDGAAFIETIATKIADKKMKAMDEKYQAQLEDLEVAKQATTKEKEYGKLLKIHPDFEEMANTETALGKTFHQWLATKPQKLQDSIYENSEDADWAASTVDLFKGWLEKQEKPAAKPARKDPGAAAHINSSGPSPTPTMQGDGKRVWKESEIKKLTTAQYEKLEPEILRAQAEGRLLQDLTRRQ